MEHLKHAAKKYKWIVIVLIALIVICCVFFVIKRTSPRKRAMPETKTFTTSIQKKDLVNTISLTGQIASTDKREITTDLKDATVKEIKVNVGDFVNNGDAIIVFDSETYEENVASLEDENELNNLKQNQSLSQAIENVENANSTYEREKENGASTVSDALGEYTQAQEKEQEAKNAYDAAVKETENQKEKYENIKSQKSSLKKEADEKAKKEAEAKVNCDTAKSSFEKAEAEIKYAKESDEGYDTLYQTYIDAQNAYTVAQSEYEKAQKDAQNAKSKYEQIDQMKQAYEQAKQAQEEALEKYKEASNTTQKNANSYQKAVNSAEETNEKNAAQIKDSRESYAITTKEVSNSRETSQKQLQQAKEELDGCVVTSPISGYITQINVEPDDTYNTGETLFVVQDLSGFIVEASVDEADIASIEKGQKAVIKTDATEDEELEGEVTYVALTPETTSSANDINASSSATYKIEIKLANANEKLRVGMTAKTSIVLEEAKDVYCVPYDCIEEKDGKSTITVVENNEQKVISVTTGLESDYYVEIQSDELNENMKILTQTGQTTESSNSFPMIPMGGNMNGGMQGGPQQGNPQMGGSGGRQQR